MKRLLLIFFQFNHQDAKIYYIKYFSTYQMSSNIEWNDTIKKEAR
jgi:hypothetical protein